MRIRIDLLGDQGGTLDLPSNIEETFFITKSIYDLRDLQTRKGDTTKTITLPKSSNNKRLLQDIIPAIARHSDAPVSFFPVQIFMDGIPVLQDPIMVLASVDNSGFKTSFFGGSTSFFNQLSNDSLSLLDFSDLDFEWSLDNLVDNHMQSTSGVVFPECLWYTNESAINIEKGGITIGQVRGNAMDISESGFFVYMREVLDRILANTIGLTFDLTALEQMGTGDDQINIDEIGIACRMDLLFDSLAATPVFAGNADLGAVIYPSGTNIVLPVSVITSSNISLTSNEWIVTYGAEVNDRQLKRRCFGEKY